MIDLMPFDECQKVYIWTPKFKLVKPLTLLFFYVLASFGVFTGHLEKIGNFK
jgi:hypothetical protein